jgi:hypothetical protein
MQIPAPKSWVEFEEISLTCLKIKWSSPTLTHHGRQGQSQAGVDIYGPDELGRHIGVQCKLMEEISIKIITDEIAKAEAFKPKLQAFYFATNASSDVNLQREIRRISESRVAKGNFPVGIFFWEDLIQELVKNSSEFGKHYPDIQLRDRPTGARLLSLSDISYYGLYVNEYMRLIFGEWGMFGGEDPYQIQRLLMTTSACGASIFDAATSSKLTTICNELTAYCIDYVYGRAEKPGWEPAEELAKTVQHIVASAEYSLKGEELAAFVMGKALGYWSVNWTDLDGAREKDLLEVFQALRPTEQAIWDFRERIKKCYDDQKAQKIDAGNTPHRLFNIVRRMISRREMKSD